MDILAALVVTGDDDGDVGRSLARTYPVPKEEDEASSDGEEGAPGLWNTGAVRLAALSAVAPPVEGGVPRAPCRPPARPRTCAPLQRR